MVLVDENATGPGTTHAEVVVTHRPDAWTGSGAELVAVALPALARRFDDALRPGAIDAASAVMSYGDQLGWAPEPDPTLDALVDGPLVVRHESLVPPSAGVGDAGPGPRALVGREVGSVASTLREVLALLAADGSAVVLSPATAGLLSADEQRLQRLVSTERVTR